ncbi:hypothetical protein Q3G72_016334 [Acer saccharum]|nr:hypothetical protein Q3G72_016334 [Acer saccharum]
MSTQKFIRGFYRIHPPSNPHQQTASNIVQDLTNSGIELFNNSPLILSTLNSQVIQLVFSNPKLPLSSCLEFYKLLLKNPAPKPDLVAHFTLIRRLYSEKMFTDIRFVLNCIANDTNLQTPVSNIVSLVEDGSDDPIFVEKLCRMLFRVYSDNGMFVESIWVFDYMEKSGFKIRDKFCRVLLLALNKRGQMDMCFSFFRRMVGANVDITAHSMTTVIHGLCKGGKVEKAKDLMEEMVSKGIEPKLLTYNILINGYCINGTVDKAFKMKAIMEQKGFEPNAFTYNIIAGGLCKLKRKSSEALKLFSEMKQRGILPNVCTYTTIVLELSKQGRTDEALRLYDEMKEYGITPNDCLYSLKVGSQVPRS